MRAQPASATAQAAPTRYARQSIVLACTLTNWKSSATARYGSTFDSWGAHVETGALEPLDELDHRRRGMLDPGGVLVEYLDHITYGKIRNLKSDFGGRRVNAYAVFSERTARISCELLEQLAASFHTGGSGPEGHYRTCVILRNHHPVGGSRCPAQQATYRTEGELETLNWAPSSGPIPSEGGDNTTGANFGTRKRRPLGPLDHPQNITFAERAGDRGCRSFDNALPFGNPRLEAGVSAIRHVPCDLASLTVGQLLPIDTQPDW